MMTDQTPGMETAPAEPVKTVTAPVGTPCSCGKPGVFFGGVGKGTDKDGKPYDEPTGPFCSDCFQLALKDFADVEKLLAKDVATSAPEVVNPDARKVVEAINGFTNAMNANFRGLIVALGKIEKRVT